MCGPLVFGLSREHIQIQSDATAGHSLSAQTMDLRTIFIDPDSLQGPMQTPSSPGLTCTIKAWSPGRFAHKKTDLTLTLTPHTDPATEAIYFKLPNPNHAALLNDELLCRE